MLFTYIDCLFTCSFAPNGLNRNHPIIDNAKVVMLVDQDGNIIKQKTKTY